MAEFVALRIEETIRRADEAGDKPGLAWALGSRDLLARMDRDVDLRPWARREVANYLFRAARAHRQHPDFVSWWG